jgi:hypothetical protein
VAGNGIGQNYPPSATQATNFSATIQGSGSVWRENTFYAGPFTLTFASGSANNVWRDNTLHATDPTLTVVDQGENNAVQAGVTTAVTATEGVAATWRSNAAGGHRWDWLLSSGSGSFPGGLWLRDVSGTGAITRFAVTPANAATWYSPAGDKAALWVAPTDNTNANSTPLLAGLTSGTGAVIQWYITKNGQFFIQGNQVVGPRQPAIAAPSGGATVDTQARTAIADILAALRAHGLIAT